MNEDMHSACQIRCCSQRIYSLFPLISRQKRNAPNESFLNKTNSQYLENLYNSWKQEPQSVDSSWHAYFKTVAQDQSRRYHDLSTKTQPSEKISSISVTKVAQKDAASATSAKGPDSTPSLSKGLSQTDNNESKKKLDVNYLILSYQNRGHLIADTDPLGIQNPHSHELQASAKLPPEIVVRRHVKGMTQKDLDKEFSVATTFIGGTKKELPLKEIIMKLNKIYCGHLGLEFKYIHDMNVADWIRYKFEPDGAWDLPAEHRRWTWLNILKAFMFESFLAKKYGTEKRFGLEGCEAFIPCILQCMETCSEKGTESIVIGMAHRGRLNTLANVCLKPMYHLFTQFNPVALEGSGGSGDVKYHLGMHAQRLLERSGKKINIAILANSSHLEAVDPLIVGRVRAEQVERTDTAGKLSLAILVHGDAAFSGQGICYETLHLTNLMEYKTGGVIHIVINNQIGFTTDPRFSRSSTHCTDVARVVNAPIFHINADDPDLVTFCSKVAAEYRMKFHNDVVLDIVGYRRNGHNEMDEPMLTQPLMYKRIKNHPNIFQKYSKKLLKEGIITEKELQMESEKYTEHCEAQFQIAQSESSMQLKDWYDIPYIDFFSKQSPKSKIPSTGIELNDIKKICHAFSTPPRGIEPHKQVLRLMERRKQLTKSRIFDWAMCEALAFLSLLKDGHHVRLSGQDVERGTFSHRIHIIHDQNQDKRWGNILKDVFPGQALYTVSNSSLSEYGVLGFEVGYSTYNHNTLTIWEAQFGDFANTASVIIDSVISSGQSKWGRQIGIVLLLPHGLEGQGPEHSSARLERYLELSNDDYTHIPGSEPNNPGNETLEDIMTRQLFESNWIISYPTTPANMFHLLRRQILMPFRKPLIVMTPKTLLRHPMAQSSFDEISPNTSFKPILADTTAKVEKVKKVILCSGKVYYDLFMERKERKLNDEIALIRIEQICPFPYQLTSEAVKQYPNVQYIMWLQEEHKNQGAYHYVRDRIALALGIPLEKLQYGGRTFSSSPATGSKYIHNHEYEDMINDAMRLE